MVIQMNDENSMKIIIAVMLIVILLLAVLAAVLLIMLRKSRRKETTVKEDAPVTFTQNSDTAFTQPASDGSTLILFDDSSRMKIILTDTENSSVRYEIESEETIIGRNSQLSDVVILNDGNISQRHCKIFFRDGKAYISDLGSLNHTYVNDQLTEDEQLLNHGDIIGIGKKKFVVEFV